MYQQVYDPVAHSLGLTSIFAAIPLTLMFIMLGVFKRSPQLSALVSLLATLAVATLVYPMPLSAALSSGLFGVAFAILTIAWILVNAMWIYNMTVETGYFEVLRESFCRVSDDLRIQAIIIAYCFGALIEALAGSGVPIAICSAMLVAIGFDPVKAAVVSLVADTAPVAFGALAVPITTLNRMTDLPYNVLGAMVGRQCPIIALVIPFVLVLIVDGFRGLRETWPAALAGGLAFALAQYIVSNFVAVPLSDIVASLASAAAIVALTRVWSPKSIMASAGAKRRTEPGKHGTLLAYAPYIFFIVVIFSLAQVPPIASVLAQGVFKFQWPGLDLTQIDEAGKVAKINTTLTVNYLSVAGTLLFVSGILTMITLRVSVEAAVRVRHELVRANEHAWPLPRGRRPRLRAFVSGHRLDRRRRDGIGQFDQRPVRSPSDRGGQGNGHFPGPSRCIQHHGRGLRQNAFAAEPRDWRRRGRAHRPRRRHFPQRIRLGGRPPRGAVPVCLSSIDACAGLDDPVSGELRECLTTASFSI
jgi:lactate permease